MNDSLIGDIAQCIAEFDSGHANPSFLRLSGGGNNQSFRFTQNGRHYFVKRYFSHPSDTRDRQGNELRFLSLLQQHQIADVPQVLGYDLRSRFTIFNYIAGTKLESSAVSDKEISALANFFIKINTLRSTPEATNITVASESFFSLPEHLTCVSNRLDRLNKVDELSEFGKQLSVLVRNRLLPFFQTEHGRLTASSMKYEGYWNDISTDRSLRVLTPSDFGFHNTLFFSGSLYFLDFEYAGWDDPAKTICDLFWQVSHPLTEAQVRLFFDLLQSDFVKPDRHLLQRINTLLPIYGVKWCCIVLNHFTTQDRQRKQFSQSDSLSEVALNQQLQKAEKIVEKLETRKEWLF